MVLLLSLMMIHSLLKFSHVTSIWLTFIISSAFVHAVCKWSWLGIMVDNLSFLVCLSTIKMVFIIFFWTFHMNICIIFTAYKLSVAIWIAVSTSFWDNFLSAYFSVYPASILFWGITVWLFPSKELHILGWRFRENYWTRWRIKIFSDCPMALIPEVLNQIKEAYFKSVVWL